MRSARAARAFLVGSLAVLASCEELPNIPPVATFVYSPVSPIVSGQSIVVFNASGSTDADGTVRSYTWEFGDGSAAVRADGPSTTHVFPDTPATCAEIVYTTLLTVEDDGGSRASTSQQVRVVELPPIGSLACANR